MSHSNDSGELTRLNSAGEKCELCHRITMFLTEHHLIPKATHSKRVKRKYGEECRTRKALFCIPCHRQIHYLFSNKQLEKDFNSLESLFANPDVMKYVDWIKDKPTNFLPTKGKRKH